VLASNCCLNGDVTVSERVPNEYTSSVRSEIVTCRFADQTELRLLCKYEARDTQTWSDVAYEAKVYRDVLQPLAGATPSFYGAHVDESGRTWLVLQYLDEALPLHDVASDEAMVSAARWLGLFHAATDRWRPNGWPEFLKVYDAAFYVERAHEALGYAGDLTNGLGWIPSLYRRFEELAAARFEQHATIVHGDFYSNNILVRDEALYPIDWEMAGVDLGEMDLACLTDGWTGSTLEECELEYQRARWPAGAPEDFDHNLGVARLCLCFYSIAYPNWTSNAKAQWYTEQLRAVGEQMGLI
jgi:aminoglycoside phosphotransferase (APT) family kinase protein